VIANDSESKDVCINTFAFKLENRISIEFFFNSLEIAKALKQMSLIGGKLKFKGTFQKKIENEEKTLKKTILGLKEKPESLIKESSEPKKKQIIEYPVTQGTGRILTSGNRKPLIDFLLIFHLKLHKNRKSNPWKGHYLPERASPRGCDYRFEPSNACEGGEKNYSNLK
jgi:hypothetical protein